MESKRKTILLVIVSIVAILVMGLFFALWNPALPPTMQMPVPNGYTQFVQAGNLLQKQTRDFEKMDEVALLSLVEANSNAVQTARAGLAEKSRVPMDYSQSYALSHPADLVRLRDLAFAFIAEGRLAEMEQHTNAAAQSYLDAARLGINSRKGGTLIDALIGFAMEAMGTRDLQEVVPSLDAKTSAELARQFETAESDKESWEQILQNEKYWLRQTYPGFNYRIAEIFTWSQLKAARNKGKQKYDAQLNLTRRLMLDLAAHAYQLDKGHRPASVADLAPAYLKSAPIDPLTGKEMTLTP